MPIKRKVTKAGTVRYYVETRSAGRKVYHPGGYATRREAEAALAKLTVAKGEGTYRAPTTTTTGDYLTAWVASHKKLRPRTRQEYERVLRTHVLPVIGDVRLDRLRPEHVQRVIDRACDRGLAVATVEKVQRTIHAALRLAVARGTLTTNPAERGQVADARGVRAGPEAAAAHPRPGGDNPGGCGGARDAPAAGAGRVDRPATR